MSTSHAASRVAPMLSLAFGVTAAAYEPSLPQNRIVAPELGPIEPLHPRLGDPTKPANGTDIAIAGLGFGGDGRITYVITNRGREAATMPFVADIEVDGKRADTIKHPPLPARSQQRVVSNIAEPAACGPTKLRVMADSQQVVPESDETNNAASREPVPPCPDLTARIEKDSVNNNLEYYAKVRVKNGGNLVAKGPFTVRVNIQAGATAVAKLKEPTLDSLAPGETFTIKDDEKHWNTTPTTIHVVVDRFRVVRESDETNNVVSRTLGGL